MGISCRRFLLDQHDALHRLAESRFDRMLGGSKSDRLPRFAGQRVRMAEVLVEMKQRTPVRVVRRAFSLVTVDARGSFQRDAFLQQQMALAEGATAPALPPAQRDSVIVDQRHQFVAQGGRWAPSPALKRAIDQAALGHISTTRL